MNKEKLTHVLSIIDGVHINKWNIALEIIELIKNDDISIIYKSHENLDLSNIYSWAAYEECIDLNFTFSKELYCDVKIFNNDSFSGARKNLRFTAKLLIPDDFILKLEKNIESKFEYYLNESYENHLLSMKSMWIMKTRQEIIGD